MVDAEERCSQAVYRGLWSHRSYCVRRGVVVRGGKKFCKQHDPEAVKAKKEERSRKWDAKWDAQAKQWDRENVIQSLCRDVDTDIIKKLGEGWLAKHLGKKR